ncbi:MAG: hypothetical protein JNK63_04480 [Chthonomonas sp.]|nr:hypothetical protein [Chthonomonas sp.]
MAQFCVRREFEDPVSTNKPDVIDGLTGVDGLGVFLDSLSSYERLPRERCPACEFSVHELVATGLLGCPVCYEAFADTIRRQLDKADLVL